MAHSSAPQIVGRYAIYEPIAEGGMATVHLGRLLGEAGFARTVAVKRLQPHLAVEPEFAKMFVDEARLAARIRHPNVVPTLDIVSSGNDLFIVMEYVEGESLAQLLYESSKRRERCPPAVAAAIITGVLHGLHAAHEAKSDQGTPLQMVHRDISPQNVLIGVDGAVRVADFGLAKARGQLHTTREGQIRGKLAYMAPEQAVGGAVTRRTDLFAVSAVFWETLVGRRLFDGKSDAETVYAIFHGEITPPSSLATDIEPGLDAIVLRGLSREAEQRFATAADMAAAIEEAAPIATPRAVAEWVKRLVSSQISMRAKRVARIESESLPPPPVAPMAPTPAVFPVDAGAAGSMPLEPTVPDARPSVEPPGRGLFASPDSPDYGIPSVPSSEEGAQHAWSSAILWTIAAFFLLATLVVALLWSFRSPSRSPAPADVQPSGVPARR